jgi:hypothetical protein
VLLIILTATACEWGGTAGPATADQSAKEIRELGSTPFSQLGYASTDVVGSPEKSTFSFDFPKDAAQGPRIWYVLHLHFEVVLAPDSDGIVLVSASTNERTAAQVEIEARPGQPMAHSAISLIDGRTRTVADSRSADVRFSNYLQQEGVRPGPVRFSVSAETLGGARVERLTVFDDSALEATTNAPYTLSLTPASAVTPTPVAGKRFSVKYSLGVQNGRNVSGVAVNASTSDGLQIVGSRDEDIGQLAQSYDGKFTFLAAEAGEYEIHLRAKSDSNHPAATVRVRVVDPPPNGPSPLLLGAVGVLVVAVVLGSRTGRRVIWKRRTEGSRKGAA